MSRDDSRTAAKVMPLADAWRRTNDGDTIALEGFARLIPLAAGRAGDAPGAARDLTLNPKE